MKLDLNLNSGKSVFLFVLEAGTNDQDGIWGFTHQQSSELWAGCVSVLRLVWADGRSPIPGGDLREAKPYMIVNTGLRRLGCGARAALGIESPV
jgi:hypothetical protein